MIIFPLKTSFLNIIKKRPKESHRSEGGRWRGNGGEGDKKKEEEEEKKKKSKKRKSKMGLLFKSHNV
jgi:hypothetical protein